MIELTDCIVLSSFTLNLLSLASSVDTLRFYLLNTCCSFNINQLLSYESLMFFT